MVVDREWAISPSVGVNSVRKAIYSNSADYNLDTLFFKKYVFNVFYSFNPLSHLTEVRRRLERRVSASIVNTPASATAESNACANRRESTDYKAQPINGQRVMHNDSFS